MIRKIKFRIWDNRNNNFVDPREIDLNENQRIGDVGEVLIDFEGNLRFAVFPCGNGDNSADSVFSKEWSGQENFIIQQFTGLQDKNGKDIYEGDYLSGRNTPILVEYQAPSFAFKYKNLDGGFCSHYIVGWADFEGEIIGNNIQHPNLGSETMVKL